jgi:hypothetical protein
MIPNTSIFPLSWSFDVICLRFFQYFFPPFEELLEVTAAAEC